MAVGIQTDAEDVVKEPDRQVQARLSYMFELFAELRVARRVLVRLRREKLTVPAKVWGGPRHGTGVLIIILWADPVPAPPAAK